MEAPQEVTTVCLDAAVQFHTLLDDVIPARLAELKHTSTGDAADNAGDVACVLSLEVSWETYERILDATAFTLLPEARRDSGTELEQGRPVELRVLLRPALTRTLATRGVQPEELAVALVNSDRSPDLSVLLLTESWLAIEVKQRVELPADLAESGALRVGYRTLWAPDSGAATGLSVVGSAGEAVEDGARAHVPSPGASSDERPLIESVAEFLTTQGLSFEPDGERILRLTVQGQHGRWPGLAAVDQDRGYCTFYSVFPHDVPAPLRSEAAEFLIDANYVIDIGSFEMDMEDGEVRFRTSIDVERDRLSPALLRNLVGANVAGMDQHWEQLSRLAGG